MAHSRMYLLGTSYNIYYDNNTHRGVPIHIIILFYYIWEEKKMNDNSEADLTRIVVRIRYSRGGTLEGTCGKGCKSKYTRISTYYTW